MARPKLLLRLFPRYGSLRAPPKLPCLVELVKTTCDAKTECGSLCNTRRKTQKDNMRWPLSATIRTRTINVSDCYNLTPVFIYILNSSIKVTYGETPVIHGDTSSPHETYALTLGSSEKIQSIMLLRSSLFFVQRLRITTNERVFGPYPPGSEGSSQFGDNLLYVSGWTMDKLMGLSLHFNSCN